MRRSFARIPVSKCEPCSWKIGRIAVDPGEEKRDLRRLGESMLPAHRELTAKGRSRLDFVHPVGQLMPIIVVEVPEAIRKTKALRRYQILVGQRRWQAAKLVGIRRLDALVYRPTPTMFDSEEYRFFLDLG